MSSGGFGSGPKKETVYSGPAPLSRQGGPSTTAGFGRSGGSAYGAASGDVSRQAAKLEVARTGGDFARAARVLFLIAGFTAANMLLTFVGVRFAIGLGATQIFASDATMLLVANGMAIGLFVLLGVFAGNGNKVALLAGMLLYGGDLVWLLANQPAVHLVSIAVHAVFLVSLFKTFPRGT
jgi:hypothetical protein